MLTATPRADVMRFSLKWLLAGTAYAAVAAAALTQDSWIWADIVWALSLVAFAFALVVACFELPQVIPSSRTPEGNSRRR